MTPIKIPYNGDASQTVLDIKIIECEAGLELGFDYMATIYDQESMERFGKLLITIARRIISEALEKEHRDMATLFEQIKQDR